MKILYFKMKKFFIIFLLIFFVINLFPSFCENVEKDIDNLAESLASIIIDRGVKKIAVTDFLDEKDNITQLGIFIADKLSISLSNKAKVFKVFERNQLQTIFKEYNLSLKNITDPENREKLGRITGVDALIIGRLIELEGSDFIKVTTKIIEVSTGEIIGGGTINVPTKGPWERTIKNLYYLYVVIAIIIAIITQLPK